MAAIDKPKGTVEGAMNLLTFMQTLASGRPVKTHYLFTVRHYRWENGKRLIYRLTTVGYNPKEGR